MTDVLRYRIVDEPKSGALQRFALPPLLVFIVGNLFLPWGWLLVAYNAVALGGPHRNREIGCALAAIAIYFGASFVLARMILSGALTIGAAKYVFVLAIGAAVVFIAKAYVSQAETTALRKYLERN